MTKQVRPINMAGQLPAVDSILPAAPVSPASEPVPLVPSSIVQFTVEQKLNLRELQVRALAATQALMQAQAEAQAIGQAFNQALQRELTQMNVRDAELDLTTLVFKARAARSKA